ncbi:hypothetical protein JTE90_014271 [Oedothorax gibbosus]|uniref:Carboxylesterase type B domain-containing protein n=1 Tax=Oedothorax gibbosus TaxID=931172 RepID=A0AAV6TYQ1_9ARAC|nr:hypothetical protein JTE90_014271 [Oedothorax gibbosus]
MGNQALSDIGKAYEWVSDNIKYFGGDKGRNGNQRLAKKEDRHSKYPITIVGHGCGALALSLLQMPSRGYLPGGLGSDYKSHQVVLDGMSILTLKALEGVDNTGESALNNLRLTQILAEKVGCPSARDDPDATMECLKGIEASRLVRTAASLSRGRGPPNVFLPQIYPPVEGFLYNPFRELKYQNESQFRDTYATFTSDAGSALLTTAFPKLFGAFGEKDVPLSANCAKKVARRFLRKFPQTVADELLGDLDINATTSNKDKLVQVFGEAYFKCPMVYLGEYRNDYKLDLEGRPKPKFYILEKKVNPPYNPFASWMGSVGFNTAQINFPHPDGQITVNNQTYKYTDEQKEQLRVNQKLLRSYMKLEKLPIPEFTLEEPAYSVMHLDGKISEEKTNFQSRNCEILRPYFKFHRDTYGTPFEYEPVFWFF